MLPQFNTIYQYYGDNVAPEATVTVQTGSGSADPDYGPESLIDDNPAKVSKIDSTTGAWMFEFDAPQRIDLVALIHHNFDAGANVKIQANTSDSWGTPALEASFTIDPWYGTGTHRWPRQPWLDLTGSSGVAHAGSVTGYTTAGYAFWRLIVTSNSQNLQLGGVWFGETIRRFDPDLRWGLTVGAAKPRIRHRTSFEVATTYSRGTTIWRMDAELLADDDMAEAIKEHWFEVDGRPWLIVPSGPIEDTQAYLVEYAMPDWQVQWNWENYHDMRLSFQEIGRGVRPGT